MAERVDRHGGRLSGLSETGAHAGGGVSRPALDARQQRGVSVLAGVSIVILAGLVSTGLWQFFTHESDPSWFDHVAGSSSRQQAAPSEGIADLHGVFATAGGVVALLGGAWFAYRDAFNIPWIALLAIVLAAGMRRSLWTTSSTSSPTTGIWDRRPSFS